LEPSQAGLVLSLITVRSYGPQSDCVYQEGDRYREMPHRQCILMNRSDIVRAGLRAHQRVAVQGEAGVMEGIEIIPEAVKEGAGLMFYSEVNVLMRGHRDPQSGTPAYKRVQVLVRG